MASRTDISSSKLKSVHEKGSPMHRKVYLTEDTEEDWSLVHDANAEAVVHCWRHADITASRDDEEPKGDASCGAGCAAFTRCEDIPGKAEYICCLALPRDCAGNPAVIGELVEPIEDEDMLD